MTFYEHRSLWNVKLFLLCCRRLLGSCAVLGKPRVIQDANLGAKRGVAQPLCFEPRFHRLEHSPEGEPAWGIHPLIALAVPRLRTGKPAEGALEARLRWEIANERHRLTASGATVLDARSNAGSGEKGAA